ncbi:MAG: CoA-binding protein [Ignavibacteria bacterium]|nr:CoA-binding protein [Ignavibacteria bacterium]
MTTVEILNKYKTIAVVGFSDNPDRDSNAISLYMKEKGYNIIGVNPKLGGKTINGIICYSELKDIPGKVEIVNIFRKSEALPEIVNQVIALKNRPDVIWTQLGVIDSGAKKTAEDSGFEYIENKCIYVEHKLNHIK